MPTKEPKGRRKGEKRSLRSFWRDWRVVIVLAVLILGAVAVYQLVFRPAQKRELEISAPYRPYFTQGGAGTPAPQGLEAEILADVAKARESVDVATPGLDLEKLPAGLIEARGRGVTVRVLEDQAAQADATVAAVSGRLEQAGIPIVLHPSGGGLGESFLVVDQRLVWAGSCALSQAGLQQDAGYLVRWDLPALAQGFHSEFLEMFDDRSFGPSSPTDSPHTYLAVPDHGIISIYFTPEGDPFGEILQALTGAQGEILVLTEKLADQRLADRLIGEAQRPGVGLWGLVDPNGGSSPAIVGSLTQKAVQLASYRGAGRLRENVLILDGQTVILFSQALDQQALDHNDGFVIVVRDQGLGQAFVQEFRRLFGQAQGQP